MKRFVNGRKSLRYFWFYHSIFFLSRNSVGVVDAFQRNSRIVMSDCKSQQHPLSSWKGLCCLSRHRRRNNSNIAVIQAPVGSNEDNIPSSTYPPSKRRRKKEPPTEQQQQQRLRRIKNRPGYNSYLKVLLDDHTIDTLHSYSIQIQKRLQQQNNNNNINQNQEENNNEEKESSQVKEEQKQQSNKKRVQFKPRSKQSLHMTLFFGGETLCEIPDSELIDWYKRIQQRLLHSGFVIGSTLQEQQPSEVAETTTTIDNEEQKEKQQQLDDDYSFQVQGLKVFPPRRNNLVVAVLEPTTTTISAMNEKESTIFCWDELYQDIQTISQDESCSQGIAEICKSTGREKWVAHVTLGNIYGGKKQTNPAVLNPILNDIFHGNGGDNHDGSGEGKSSSSSNGDGTSKTKDGTWRAYCQGIAMGGPIPQQVELDWNFMCRGK